MGLQICLVSRDEPGTTGTSRYVTELARGLTELGVDTVQVGTNVGPHAERALGLGRALAVDAPTFLSQYPLMLRWPAGDIYHLTVQSYATSLLFARPPGPVVVTVHDIIPYLVRSNPALSAYGHPLHRLFDWLAMQGLKRADALIADSNWTKQSLIAQLGIEPSRVALTPLGVDGERFRPLEIPPSFRTTYGLPSNYRYILYVGSEDRRKNLPRLWQAVAQVCADLPDVHLLKVGPAYASVERRRLERLAAELGITHAVRFFDVVPEADLPFIYNAATVCVLPSLYEGFGLPVLEAMACGTRVVCSDAASLPEVAGADALLCRPTVEGIAVALKEALHEDPQAGRERRLAWTRQFSWPAMARQTYDVYQGLGRNVVDRSTVRPGLSWRVTPRFGMHVGFGRKSVSTSGRPESNGRISASNLVQPHFNNQANDASARLQIDSTSRTGTRSLGSTEDFEQDWADALREQHPRWFAFPDWHRDEQIAVMEAAKAEQVLELLRHHGTQSGRVLEYGCGAAGMSVFLKERGYQAIAVDVSMDALEVARLNDQQHRSDTVPLVRIAANALRLPFADRQFDIVMSYGLLEHFELAGLQQLVAEVCRTLRPGGLFVADIIPARRNARWVGNLLNFSASACRQLLRAQISAIPGLQKAYFDHYHETSFGPEVYAAVLRDAGLHSVEVKVCRPFPVLAVDGALERLYVRLMRTARPMWQAFDRSDSALARCWGWMYLTSGSKPYGAQIFQAEAENGARDGTRQYGD